MQQNSLGKFHWPLFIIWPFLSAVFAVKNYRASWAKNIIWAFVIFYGFTFEIGEESASSDIVRYTRELKELHRVDNMTIAKGVAYFEGTEEVDILRTVIAVLLSRITDDQNILTAVYGFIFGFFFSRNLWFIINRLNGSFSSTTWFLLLVFSLIVPIWTINGFRMYTAMHMFFFGLVRFFDKKEIGGLILCFLTWLVHFSFLLPIAVLVIYLLFGNRTNIYFIFFIISIFISEINIEAFNTFMQNNLPVEVVERSSSYLEEEKVEKYRKMNPLQSEKRWYAVLYMKMLIWALTGFLIYIFIKAKDAIKKDKFLLRIFSFSLLIFAVSNMLSSIPGGARFLTLAALFSIAGIIYYLQNNQQVKYIKFMNWIAIPMLVIFVVVQIRNGLYSFGVATLISNPIVALITGGESVAINDLIK